MKSADLQASTVYAYEKDSYGYAQPVLVLDNKLWTMGIESEWSEERFLTIRLAKKGDRPNDGGWRQNRRCGIPVLMIGQSYHTFTDWSGYRNDSRIIETPAELFEQALKKMGLTGAQDLERKFLREGGTKAGQGVSSDAERNFRSVEVVVTRPDGVKGTITIVLTTVRPQTISDEWTSFVESKRKEHEAQRAFQARKDAEAARKEAVNEDVKKRLDALLGEAPSYRNQRDDASRDQYGHFSVTEETFLRLLELAEKGAGK
jgi:hypothetical protein